MSRTSLLRTRFKPDSLPTVLLASLATSSGVAQPTHDALHRMAFSDNGHANCTVESSFAMQYPSPHLATAPLPGGDVLSRGADPGLRIVLRATGRLQANPAASLALLRAAARWERRIATPVTVVIDVDFGTDFFGAIPFDASTLALTDPGVVRGFPYEDIRSRLIEGSAGGALEQLHGALPAFFLPIEGEQPRNVVDSSFAAAQALGYFPGPLPVDELPQGLVASIGFNSEATWDLDPADGVTGGRFDFDALAVHEIGHALGFLSLVSAVDPAPAVAPLDLFRLRPASAATHADFTMAPRVLRPGPTGSDHVLWSGPDAPEVPFSTAGPDFTGGDGRQASHWRDSLRSPFVHHGVMHPTFLRDRRYLLTNTDFLAMSIIGWRVIDGGSDARALFMRPNIPGGVLPGGVVQFDVEVGNLEPFWPLEVAFDHAAVSTRFGSNPAAIAINVAPGAFSVPASDRARHAVSLEVPVVWEVYDVALRFRTNDPNRLIHEVRFTLEVFDGVAPAAWLME